MPDTKTEAPPDAAIHEVQRQADCMLQGTVLVSVAVYLALVVAFALLYAVLDRYGGREHFGFKHLIDPLYFAAVTSTTVGYGDFTPKTGTAKAFVLLQFVATSALILTFFTCVAGTIQAPKPTT